jgi:hypothetical protein
MQEPLIVAAKRRHLVKQEEVCFPWLTASSILVVFRLWWNQLRLEQGLAGLEHHLVVDLEQFVNEQPRSVRALLLAITVC